MPKKVLVPKGSGPPGTPPGKSPAKPAPKTPAKDSGKKPEKIATKAILGDSAKKYVQTALFQTVPSPNRKVTQEKTQNFGNNNPKDGVLKIWKIQGHTESEGLAASIVSRESVQSSNYAARFLSMLVQESHEFVPGFRFAIRGRNKDFHLYINNEQARDPNGDWLIRTNAFFGPSSVYGREELKVLATVIANAVKKRAGKANIVVDVEDDFLTTDCVWADVFGKSMAIQFAKKIHDVTPGWGIGNPDMLHTFIRPGEFTAEAARELYAPMTDVMESERAYFDNGDDVIDVDSQSDAEATPQNDFTEQVKDGVANGATITEVTP